ncbi:MAG: hypothetical protein LCH84_01090 [Gemmatimonadetes bacterium]|nr:hypothetical protein [Gemmatimonadota bacterium]
MSRTRTLHRTPRLAVAALFLTMSVAACSDDPGSPTPANPLAGLVGKPAVDSAGHGIPVPLSPSGAGFVRGTVIAPSAPGAGNDSLNTATRIAGVIVRVYPVIGSPDVPSPTLGAVVATDTTDATGQFQTPVIAGGQSWHVLTFTPPTGSAYQAVWSRTQFWTQSSERRWWVTLPRTP